MKEMAEQVSMFDLDSEFGKMCLGYSHQTREKTSELCWKNLSVSEKKTLQFLDARSGRRGGYILGDTWSLAWRTMDAQYWGVPQRRKRIALIVDFAGQCAGEILFERESVSGHPEPSIEAWKGIARNPSESVGECCTLKIRGGVERDSKGNKAGKGPLIQNNLSGTLGVSQDQTLFCNSSGGVYQERLMPITDWEQEQGETSKENLSQTSIPDKSP